ncbi:hypothetical protein D3C71_2052060 [compost metagenome]
MASVLLKVLGNGLDRCCEVGCDRDLDFVGPGTVDDDQAGEGGDGQVRQADAHEDCSWDRLSLYR